MENKETLGKGGGNKQSNPQKLLLNSLPALFVVAAAVPLFLGLQGVTMFAMVVLARIFSQHFFANQ